MQRFALLLLMLLAALPAGACLVAIDAGHSEPEPGATSARGRGEWHFNAELSGRLAASLEAASIPFVLVNPEGKDISLRERTQAAKKAKATLLLSIHHDSVQPHYLSGWEWQGQQRLHSDRFSGYSLFVSLRNTCPAESLEVAWKIADGLLNEGLKPSPHHAEPIPGENRQLLSPARGIYRFDELVVLREAPVAAVLLEAGVIVNRGEEILLEQAAHQEKIIRSLVSAIRAHCGRAKSAVGAK